MSAEHTLAELAKWFDITAQTIYIIGEANISNIHTLLLAGMAVVGIKPWQRKKEK